MTLLYVAVEINYKPRFKISFMNQYMGMNAEITIPEGLMPTMKRQYHQHPKSSDHKKDSISRLPHQMSAL